jgi:hypothetical protein
VPTATSTAASQLAVDHNSRDAPHTVLLCPGRHFRLLHIVNFNFMSRPGNPTYKLNRLLAGHAPSNEHFNFSSVLP